MLYGASIFRYCLVRRKQRLTDVLSGKLKGTDHLNDLLISWDFNFKGNPKETLRENMDWILLAQRINHWRAIMDSSTGLWGLEIGISWLA
jgi:hypothetical protein